MCYRTESEEEYEMEGGDRVGYQEGYINGCRTCLTLVLNSLTDKGLSIYNVNSVMNMTTKEINYIIDNIKKINVDNLDYYLF